MSETAGPAAAAATPPDGGPHTDVTHARDTTPTSGNAKPGAAGTAATTAVTVRNRQRLFSGLHLPDFIVDPRASIAELAAWAHHGDYAPPGPGPLRDAGVWWFRWIALPLAAHHRLCEWLIVRPLRGVPGLVVVVCWRAIKLAALIHFVHAI